MLSFDRDSLSRNENISENIYSVSSDSINLSTDNISICSDIHSIDTPSYVGIRLTNNNNFNIKSQSNAPVASLVKSYDNSKVLLTSIDDTFWCKIDPVSDKGMNLWIESKKDRKQWDIIVLDSELSSYSSDTSNLPLNVLALYLANAFSKTDSSSSIDAKLIWKGELEYLNINLTINISEIWKIYFSFELKPIEVDEISKLNSR